MGKVLKRFATLMLGSLSLLLASCGDEGCTAPTVSFTIADFQDLGLGNKISTLSVYGIGSGQDTLAMAVESGQLQAVPLILNPNSNQSRLRLEMMLMNEKINDTLTFHYQRTPYFISIDCGCTVYFTLDSVSHTGNIIQEIEITNPSVTNEKKPNITIRY